MKHELFSTEDIKEFRWMCNSPMPEHNIYTHTLLPDRDPYADTNENKTKKKSEKKK